MSRLVSAGSAPGASPAIVVAGLALTVLAWGYNWVVMKHSVLLAPVIPLIALRLLVAASGLFAAIALMRQPWRVRHPGSVMAIGLINTAGSFVLMMWALQSSDAGKCAMLVYTMPFFVILVAWPALGERPSRLQWWSTGIALLGMILLIDPFRDPRWSDLFAVASGLFWGVGVVLVRRHQTLHPDDTLALSAWQNLVGGVALVFLSLPQGLGEWTVNGYLVFAVLYTGALVSGLSVAGWFWLLRHVDSGVASLCTLATPVLGLLFSMLEFGERPSRLDWLGIALIVLALAVLGWAASGRLSRSGRRAAPAPGVSTPGSE